MTKSMDVTLRLGLNRQQCRRLVGHVELRQTLMSVSANCHLIERLFFESSKTGRDDSLKAQTCFELVNNCPHLTSLSLRGFKLHDCKVRVLVKGFRKLKYVDFSTSYSITGNFLRLVVSNKALQESVTFCPSRRLIKNASETLILNMQMEVARLLTAILAGDFKFLVHLDISNREGLASEADWYHRCYNSSIMPIKQVLETRPDMCLVAEYPSAEGSYMETFDADMNSEISLPSQLSSHTSDGSIFMSTSESSYNSDQGSGNEDGIIQEGQQSGELALSASWRFLTLGFEFMDQGGAVGKNDATGWVSTTDLDFSTFNLSFSLIDVLYCGIFNLEDNWRLVVVLKLPKKEAIFPRHQSM
ncbi:hypothetical protein V8G54_019398 [Vigna mungo]|uniref:F-box protein n=1 Tax=Vigna mungo TaxID=3915 RepID=A0AAQ3NBH4_VIGMU